MRISLALYKQLGNLDHIQSLFLGLAFAVKKRTTKPKKLPVEAIHFLSQAENNFISRF